MRVSLLFTFCLPPEGIILPGAHHFFPEGEHRLSLLVSRQERPYKSGSREIWPIPPSICCADRRNAQHAGRNQHQRSNDGRWPFPPPLSQILPEGPFPVRIWVPLDLSSAGPTPVNCSQLGRAASATLLPAISLFQVPVSRTLTSIPPLRLFRWPQGTPSLDGWSSPSGKGECRLYGYGPIGSTILIAIHLGTHAGSWCSPASRNRDCIHLPISSHRNLDGMATFFAHTGAAFALPWESQRSLDAPRCHGSHPCVHRGYIHLPLIITRTHSVAIWSHMASVPVRPSSYSRTSVLVQSGPEGPASLPSLDMPVRWRSVQVTTHSFASRCARPRPSQQDPREPHAEVRWVVHLTVTDLQLRRRNPASRLPPKGGFPELGVSSATSEFLTRSEVTFQNRENPCQPLLPKKLWLPQPWLNPRVTVYIRRKNSPRRQKLCN